jgi:hypothetical protein
MSRGGAAAVAAICSGVNSVPASGGNFDATT